MKILVLICLVGMLQACSKKTNYNPRINSAEIVEPSGLNGQPSGIYNSASKTLSGTLPIGLVTSIHKSNTCGDNALATGSSLDFSSGLTYSLPEGSHDIFVKVANESGSKCFGPYRNYTIDITPPQISLDSGISNNASGIPRSYLVKGSVSDNLGTPSLSFHKNNSCSDAGVFSNSQNLYNGAGVSLDQSIIDNLVLSSIYAKVIDQAGNSICQLLVSYTHLLGSAVNATSYFTIEKTIIAPKLPIQTNQIKFFARDVNNNPVSGLNSVLTISPNSSSAFQGNMVATLNPGEYLYSASVGENYLVEVATGSILFVSNRTVGNVVVTDTDYCYTNNGLNWVNHKQSGLGTNLSPYLICTAEQLKSLAESIDAGDFSMSYKLMIDLNLASFLSNSLNEFSIGSGFNSFSGSFDGNNLSILNFKPKANSYSFINKMSAGEVKNLTYSEIAGSLNPNLHSGLLIDQIITTQNVNLSNLNITGNIQIAGSASNFNFGAIGSAVITGAGQLNASKIRVNSTVTSAQSTIGGFIGYASSPSASKAVFNEIDTVLNIQGSLPLINVGGIIGEFQGGTISNAMANSTINGGNASFVGGIVGKVSQGSISESVSIGQISLVDVSGYGGLVGRVVNGSNVSDSVALQNITATNCLIECGKVIGAQYSLDNDFISLYTSNQTTLNFGSITALNVAETSIDLVAQPGYFYNEANNPFLNFDFVNLWMGVSGNYPKLRF